MNRRMRESGFTLLEIIIVITIMGFLLAMIAPRLGTIGKSAVKIIGDSNIKSMREHIVAYLQQYDRLPNKPVSIVNSAPGGKYQLPLADNDDVSDGPETIGYEFNERLRPRLYILSSDEAREITKELGIRTVMTLNDYVGSTNEEHDKKAGGLTPQVFATGDPGRPYYPVEVEGGLGVLMVGAGTTGEAGKIEMEVAEGDEIAQPEWTYRIIVAIGDDSSLVTKGMVQNTALSPSGMQSADYHTFNYYSMVLPRLKSTLSRIPNNAKMIEVVDASFDEGSERAEKRIIDICEAQDAWQVEVCSPEGQKWPKPTVDMWKVTKIRTKVE